MTSRQAFKQSPHIGALWYDTNKKCMMAYNGTVWIVRPENCVLVPVLIDGRGEQGIPVDLNDLKEIRQTYERTEFGVKMSEEKFAYFLLKYAKGKE